MIAGLWLLKRPGPAARPKDRGRPGRNGDDLDQRAVVLTALIGGGLLLLVCGAGAVALAVRGKSKPPDTAPPRPDEKEGRGAGTAVAAKREPGNTTPVGPVPAGDARTDQPVPGLVGQWTNESHGLTQVWTVRRPAGTWEVTCRYFDEANDVGSFIGLDVKLSGQTLHFTQHFDRPPPRPWPSGAAIAAKLDGSNLAYTWQFGPSSGTGTLVRMK